MVIPIMVIIATGHIIITDGTIHGIIALIHIMAVIHTGMDITMVITDIRITRVMFTIATGMQEVPILIILHQEGRRMLTIPHPLTQGPHPLIQGLQLRGLRHLLRGTIQQLHLGQLLPRGREQ